jgi:hypothetical protein
MYRKYQVMTSCSNHNALISKSFRVWKRSFFAKLPSMHYLLFWQVVYRYSQKANSLFAFFEIT